MIVPNQKPDQRVAGMVCLLLALGTLLVYSRVFYCGFTNYDDPKYILENNHVKYGLSDNNLEWAFTSGHASNWHPLTWISHMVDCQLFGLNPAGQHAVNLLFHIANVLLLFWVLFKMTGALWRCACVAALFAWHPLHVESVAWISERKDVLSTLFWLLTTNAYLNFVQASKAQNPKPKIRYLVMLALYVCGLLSKPMVVTLPFVLLLLDYWPLQRISPANSSAESSFGKVTFGRALLEKAPLMALAIGASVVTFIVQQRGGAVQSLETISFSERATNALVSYFRYLWHMVCPTDLSVFYPFPHAIPVWEWAGAAALLVAISAAAWFSRARRPYLFAGWFWYVGTLVPVIGLVQVGTQAMADRYTYIPLVGIFIAIVWSAHAFIERMPKLKVPFVAAGAATMVTLVALTVLQIGYWTDAVTLFKHAVAVTKDNTVAHVNLGEAYDKLGRRAEAKAEFEKALAIDPDAPGTFNGLGAVYAHGGDTTNAVKYFESALKKRPFFGDAHYNLGNVLAAEGKFAEAAEQYAAALTAKPDSADAHNNLGVMYFNLGRLEDALSEFKIALQYDPKLAEAEDDIAGVYLKKGQPDLARDHYAAAVQINPDSAHAQNRLGVLLAREGKLDQAVPHLQRATELDPNNGAACRELAAAFMAQGRLENATLAYLHAISADPNDATAYSLLGGVYVAAKNYDAAIKAFRNALAINPNLRGAMRNLAWILATNPRDDLRNGPEALRLAERANNLTNPPEPRMLEALDAALAEVGRFEDALKIAQQVQQLATTAGDKATADTAAKRIELYRAGKPFRE